MLWKQHVFVLSEQSSAVDHPTRFSQTRIFSTKLYSFAHCAPPNPSYLVPARCIIPTQVARHLRCPLFSPRGDGGSGL